MRPRYTAPYATVPAHLVAPKNRYEVAANIAQFLLAQGESIYGRWDGRLPAAEQRRLFGTKIGKGLIIVDGARDTVEHRVRVCFGTDWDTQLKLDCNDPARCELETA